MNFSVSISIVNFMKNDFFESQESIKKPSGPKIKVIEPNQNLKAELPPSKPTGKKFFKVFLLVLFLAILGLGGFVLVRATNLSSKIFVGEKTSFYNKLGQLVRSATGRDVLMLGEDKGQINILLLGIGGAGHDGGYLSDTIILAQIRPEDKKVSLISIPRDYLADLGPLGFRKINAAFAEGYNKKKSFNDGGEAAAAAVEKISGLDIPYFAVIDFKGFEEAVDVIGGVDVTVDRTFTDYTYPDSNEGYLPAQTFKAGYQHMNGKTALIFARSRHGNNGEGSDFARSVRQKKIMEAAKNKVTSLNIITNSGTLNELLTVLGNHFHTNIALDEMLHLYSLSKDFSSENVISLNLDPTTKLICPEILESNGAYVLSPCPGKKVSDIQNFFQNSFNKTSLGKPQVVWLADSNTNQKYYSAAEKELTLAGFTVYKISFGGEVLENSVFYQTNQNSDAAELVKKELSAKQVTLPPPGVKIDKDKVDMVIIIGADYKPPVPTVKSQTTTAPKNTTPETPLPTTQQTPKVVDPKTVEYDQ